MNVDLLLGVDIGGTEVATVIAHPSGRILKHLSTPTDLSSDAATVEGILRAIQAVMDAARVSPHDIAAIGIGAPGVVNLERGDWFGSTNVRLASPIGPGWRPGASGRRPSESSPESPGRASYGPTVGLGG